ncbi:hypothetical protein BU004_10605 [Mammaliicoccus sciuri]|uniref:hypothetical protein n=1 Tax=Mammaliicoccus sciuri TaxID=1296 RepID=UPI000E68DC72|nr:hypothetical protein [Mammaliicoccus sciuri]RIN84222.1 hypothetical protein BU004_10605 [Mammaliicoccus sciuri]
MFTKDFSLVGISVSIIIAILSVLIKKIIPGMIDSRKTIFYMDVLFLILTSLIIWSFTLIYYIMIFWKIKHYNTNAYLEILSINGFITIYNILFSLFALVLTIQVIIMLKNNFKIIIQDNEVFKNNTIGKSYLKNMMHIENKKDIEKDIDRLKANQDDEYSIKSYTMKDDENHLIEKIFVYDKSLWRRWKKISSKRDDKWLSFIPLLVFLIAIPIFIAINILLMIFVKIEGYEWLFTTLNLANGVVLFIFNVSLISERRQINIKNLEDQKRYIEKEELRFK